MFRQFEDFQENKKRDALGPAWERRGGFEGGERKGKGMQ